MASPSVPRSDGRDWLIANPWSWTALGLGCCSAAWLATLIGGGRWSAVRCSLTVLGLLSVGVAFSIRLNFTRPAFLGRSQPHLRRFLLLGLMGLFCLVAAAASVMLISSFVNDGRWGPTLICWTLVAPLSVVAANQCWRRMLSEEPLSGREEAALLLPFAAVACQIAAAALHSRSNPEYLVTIRFFLGVVSLIALVCAPLVLVRQSVRRKVVSAVIVLHLASVFTAGLYFQQSWLILQIVSRLSRSYLDFFALGNAYHYFADPGSASQLWFRITYEDGSDGPAAEWFKSPDADGPAKRSHVANVSFTRRVALIEPLTLAVTPPLLDTTARPTDVFRARLDAAAPQAHAKGGMYVPFAGDIPVMQQCQYPMPNVHKLLKSYVLHVIDHAQRDGRRVANVKIYRVKHNLLAPIEFRAGIKQPWDPDTYVPIYMGDFDAQGNAVNLTVPFFGAGTVGLLCPPGEWPLTAAAALSPGHAWNDPFLYWVVPNVRDVKHPGTFHSYVRKHAGDPAWIRNAAGDWVESEPR